MKFLVKVFAIIFGLMLVLQTVVAEGEFSDISESSYKESISSLTKKGIVEGYDSGEFKPTQLINRAELLKIVFKALGQETGEYPEGCFPDVKDEWFVPYICKAKELGIVQGYPDGTYKPWQSVNMVEALKIAVAAFDLPVDGLKENEKWYKPYVEFSHRNNLFSKFSYVPDRFTRRDEVAFLVDEFIKIQKEEKTLSAERNVKSAGCTLTTVPENPPAKFMVNGVERSAITVVPDSYKPGEPISLLFAFHGRTNSNQMVKGYYGIEKPSAGKAIIVYPAGVPNATGYSWSDSGDKAGELRDYEFFDVMLAEFSNNYCINEDKIFVVGHSLGGWFTNSLACARGDVIRAIASLGGSRSNSDCKGPVAAMVWHNPNDQQASFAGGEAARDAFIGQNQCSTEKISVEPTWGNCVAYQGCNQDAPLVFCPHNKDLDWRGDYYPHNWPNGTGAEMWKFFEELEG